MSVFRGQFDVIFENAVTEARRMDLDDLKLPHVNDACRREYI